jgi:uncharacterized RDD family membrane protein YckC
VSPAERDAFGRPLPPGDEDDRRPEPLPEPAGPAGGWLPPSPPGGALAPPAPGPEAPAWGPPRHARQAPWSGPGAPDLAAATGADRPAGTAADYGQRVGAAVVDFVVRLAIIATCTGLGAILYAAGTDAGQIGLFVGLGVGWVLGTLVYAPLMIARTNGQTLGHRASGTRIVHLDGSRLSGGKAFLREVVVKGVLMEAIGGGVILVLVFVNYLMPIWDERNQALHDKICDTRVVRT